MGMDVTAADALVKSLEACLEHTGTVPSGEPLLAGVDLGTATIVVVALDTRKKPVACAMEFAQVVRDGLVMDYAGATRIVKRLVAQVEERLGRSLEKAAIAVPPGTGPRECATHQHVVEAAGPEVVTILDEPTAANAVLGIRDGAIVDIGGGTTGISVLENGEVTYVADEPTGGTHISLVLAGNYGISFEEAESLKKDPARQKEILPVVRPVLEKMGSIVRQHVAGRNVRDIYLVGGTCCLPGMEEVIARETGLNVCKPANPFLVTPLGIALNCSR